jgi:Fumarylacetoacetate (FAA) hydrolase family
MPACLGNWSGGHRIHLNGATSRRDASFKAISCLRRRCRFILWALATIVLKTFYPGEVIASGTVPTGCGLELGRFLTPNDVIELEIDRIGILRNRIVRPGR